jgi:hypothetical protein
MDTLHEDLVRLDVHLQHKLLVAYQIFIGAENVSDASGKE